MGVTLRPLRDNVIIERVEVEKVSKGGIIIPDNVQEKPHEGIVIAVGPGLFLASGRRIEPEVKAGDRVLFGKYTGVETRAAGDEQVIVPESMIHCVLEG